MLAKVLEKDLISLLGYSDSTQVSDIIPLEWGWECEVYKVTLKEGENCTEVLLKGFPGRPLPFFPPRPEGEYRIMQGLNNLGFPVPKLHGWAGPESQSDWPFIIMEYVSGETLDFTFAQAGPARKVELLELFCNHFVQLHGLEWQGFINPKLHRSDVIGRELERLELLAGLWQPEIFAPVFSWLRAEAKGIQASLALVHWDYHSDNVLMNPQGQPYVIDWTMAEVTDYRFDLGWSLLYLEGLEDVFLERYSMLKGADLEHLHFFQTYALARRLIFIIVSLQVGSEALGMRPGATELMHNQRNSLLKICARLYKLTGVQLPAVSQIISAM